MRKRGLLDGVCQGALALGAASAFGLATAQAQTAAQPAPAAAPAGAVVVTARRIETAPAVVPLNTPYSESTITAERVENLSPQESLQTMLASQPSIYAYQDGPNGVGANIYYRAFNSGEFSETFDGVDINDIFNGGVTGQASTFNSVLFIPANIDSVVLSQGINNPAVNSYNSLGGTVNFLPKRPTDTFGGTMGASYGSFDSYSAQGSINTGDIHGLKSLLQFDSRSSQGWEKNTANDNTNIYYSGLYNVPNGNQLSMVAVWNRNAGHDPFDMPVPLLRQDGGFYQYPLSEADKTAVDTETLVIVGYKANLAPNILFENKLFGGTQNFLRTSYANPADSNSPYELPSQAENYDYWLYYPNGPTYNPKTTFGSSAAGNEFNFYGYQTFALGYTPTLTIDLPYNTITTGGNITYGQLHSSEYWYGSEPVPRVVGYNDAWDEHDRRLLASGYIQDDIKLFSNALTITPGVKYIYAHTSDGDGIGFFYPYGGAVSDSESFVAPTIGLNYKLNDHLAFNFAFGENIKFPDISAYYDAVPGTTSSSPLTPTPVKIKPEHVNDYELGARYQDGGFSIAADVYREDFTNVFIDSFNAATYETIVTNGGGARYQGVEVQLADDIRFERWGDLRGYLNYSYNQAKFTSTFQADSLGSSLSVADDTVTAGEPVADVPDTLVTGGFNWTYQGLRLSADGRYIGRQYIIDNDNGAPSNVTIPDHFVMDIGVSKTIAMAETGSRLGKSIKFSFLVNNLFNAYYYNEAYTQSNKPYVGSTEFAAPGAPRGVLGKVEVAF
jgi:outer membrane receptor protein involved in Fe transport